MYLIDPHRDDRIRLITAAGVDLDPIRDADQAWAWLRTERRSLVAMVDLALEYGLDEHAWQLGRTITTFLDRDLRWHDWLATATIALRAAERLDHPAAQAAAHRSLAHVAVQLGRLEDAYDHLRTALTLFEAADDPASQAATHNSIGGVCEGMGRYEDALAHAQMAHKLFAQAGDEIGQAHALNSIGWCEARLGRHTAALASCEQSRERLQQLGDRFGEAVAWDSTGFIQHAIGTTKTRSRATNAPSNCSDRSANGSTKASLSITSATVSSPSAAETGPRPLGSRHLTLSVISITTWPTPYGQRSRRPGIETTLRTRARTSSGLADPSDLPDRAVTPTSRS